MGQSPAVSPIVTGTTQVVAARAKALTVLGGSTKKAPSSPAKAALSKDAAADLSEQLNDEIKRRYVRGITIQSLAVFSC